MAGWTTPRTFVAGEVETAAIFNAHLRDNLNALNGFVRKTVDESVTSSAVLQADDQLLIAIPAVGTYIIDLHLITTGAAAGDMRIGATFPTGSCRVFVDALDTTVAAVNGTISRQTVALTSGVDPGVGIGQVGGDVYAHLKFILIATGTGTFTFQWAQSVSSVTATTVKTNSFLTMAQVA